MRLRRQVNDWSNKKPVHHDYQYCDEKNNQSQDADNDRLKIDQFLFRMTKDQPLKEHKPFTNNPTFLINTPQQVGIILFSVCFTKKQNKTRQIYLLEKGKFVLSRDKLVV